MNRKTLSAVSRSEMPKSVLLSYLLERAGFLEKLRRNAVWDKKWFMRPVGGGAPCEFDTPLEPVKIMTAANFHVLRDLKVSESSFVEEHGAATPKNEIDAVAVVTDSIAIGFELKWKTRTGPIGNQISKERECLRLLARYYDCGFISNVAVLPTAMLVPEADAVITLEAIHNVITEMSDRTGDPIMQLAKREFSGMGPSTAWEYVSNVESLLARADASSGNECVGYQKGLSDLRACSLEKIQKRPSWKISQRTPDRSWFPLNEVAEIIRQKLSQTQ